MIKNNLKIKNQGFAILFTVVIVSIISIITIGLANSAYKQMVLSSVARDSTTAFYEADKAADCVIYYDYNTPGEWPSPIDCGDGMSLVVAKNSDGSHDFSSVSSLPQDKCFEAHLEKHDMGTYIQSILFASGYNLCDKNNIRTVERTIKVTY